MAGLWTSPLAGEAGGKCEQALCDVTIVSHAICLHVFSIFGNIYLISNVYDGRKVAMALKVTITIEGEPEAVRQAFPSVFGLAQGQNSLSAEILGATVKETPGGYGLEGAWSA